MFIWALSQTVWLNLVLIPDAVRSGEVWRLLTWPLANQPGIWEVLTIAIFWYFGREIEGLLGRTKFAVMLVLLAVVPGARRHGARHRRLRAARPSSWRSS